MSQHTFHSLPDFGFTQLQVQTLQHRLVTPQFLYISGPAGGGKTKAALLLAWTFFQAYRRPFRIDGQDMTTAQIRQAAIEKNAGILFHDLASTHDYMKAGYCLDCHMTAIGIAFDGPSAAGHAHAHLVARLPALTTRDDVTVVGVERDEDSDIERYRIDLHMP
jgi:energy-coupling factor transporter ATP-binding protein EcfA2